MPSKKEKKARRREAALHEMERRQQARLQASPLSRDELHRLVDFLAEEIDAHGHDGSCRLTERWCEENGHNSEAVLSFLDGERMASDFGIAVDGDPCALFGPSDTRIARMPLGRALLEELLDHLDAAVGSVGCAHDTRLARAWLTDNRLPVATTLMAFGAQGCWCDCEIVMNIDPDAFYPFQ